MSIPLRDPSNDSRTLIQAALHGLGRIYHEGFQYKKAGVLLLGLQPAALRQASLLTEPDPHSAKVMALLDGLNARYGRNTVSIAAAGIEHRWQALFEPKSACYTTKWEEVPRVQA